MSRFSHLKNFLFGPNTFLEPKAGALAMDASNQVTLTMYIQYKIQKIFLNMNLIVYNSNIEHRDGTFVSKLTHESRISF